MEIGDESIVSNSPLPFAALVQGFFQCSGFAVGLQETLLRYCCSVKSRGNRRSVG